MVHDRIAGHRHLQDVAGLDAGFGGDLVNQVIDTFAHSVGQFDGTFGFHLHVGHAAHQVFAETDLRIHDAAGSDDLAARQVAEVRGYRR